MKRELRRKSNYVGEGHILVVVVTWQRAALVAARPQRDVDTAGTMRSMVGDEEGWILTPRFGTPRPVAFTVRDIGQGQWSGPPALPTAGEPPAF